MATQNPRLIRLVAARYQQMQGLRTMADSVSLLLPDGRVLVGGGGETGFQGEVDHRDVQFYSPPYLFKGARPVITSLNSSIITYGQPF